MYDMPMFNIDHFQSHQSWAFDLELHITHTTEIERGLAENCIFMS
jgi:hypothetical protein